MHKLRFLILTILLMPLAYIHASVVFPNTNFFVDTDVFDGKTTKMFVVLENKDGNKTKEVIAFKDGDTIIATTTVSFSHGEYTKVITQKWKAITGNHSFYAEVVNNADNTFKSDAQKFFIDLDTDGDGIGNIQDNDDDNDSLPDIDDSEPLIPYKPDFLAILKEKLAQKQDLFTKQKTTETKKNPQVLGTSTESIFTPIAKPVVGTVSTLENFRENISNKIEKYDSKQRAIKKLIAKKETNHALTETDKDELRKSQIASVFTAVSGFVFHHQTIYWFHVFVLFASLLHLFWGKIKKRLNIRRHGKYYH